MAGEARQEEIRAIHKEYKLHYVIMAVVVAIGIGIFIGASVFADDLSGYAMNLVTEGFGVAISVVITVFVIDRINERRADERHTEELKRRLVRDAGSRSNDIAIAAIDLLRTNGWLVGTTGLLNKAYLKHANLQRADLSNANLKAADLQEANLQNVTLDNAELQNAGLGSADIRGAKGFRADLQGAMMMLAKLQQARFIGGTMQNANLDFAELTSSELIGVDLKEALLRNAQLQGSSLWKADLQNAKLNDANLTGANLRLANLQGAAFSSAYELNGEIRFPGTILPDGTEFQDDVDLEIFTNPYHLEYEATVEKINHIRKTIELDPIPLP